MLAPWRGAGEDTLLFPREGTRRPRPRLLRPCSRKYERNTPCEFGSGRELCLNCSADAKCGDEKLKFLAAHPWQSGSRWRSFARRQESVSTGFVALRKREMRVPGRPSHLTERRAYIAMALSANEYRRSLAEWGRGKVSSCQFPDFPYE